MKGADCAAVSATHDEIKTFGLSDNEAFPVHREISVKDCLMSRESVPQKSKDNRDFAGGDCDS